MTAVRKIADAHTRKVAEALEILVKMNNEGRLPSLLFICEEVGSATPLYGMVGRFRSDPVRAIGHLAVVKRRVLGLAAAKPFLEDAE